MPELIGKVISPYLAMELAIEYARKGTGHVSPNPLVGCTIVDRDHRLLALGAHLKVGTDHAEINALKKISDQTMLEGAHFYVTLEPCAHQGRTPSCAKTLAPLKLATVTYAVEDPNPLVSGKGAEILKAEGTRAMSLNERDDIEQKERLIDAAEDLAEIFLHNQRAKLPFVAVKVATSLDGHLALKNGESKWITGEKAREHSHAIRARYDAIGIGVKTFLTDNPSLNIRHPDFSELKNRVVVFDPSARGLEQLAGKNLLKARAAESVIWVVDSAAPDPHNPEGVRIVKARMTDNGIQIEDLLRKLAGEGVTSLMLEGGAYAIASFFAEKNVQRLHLYQAPIILGGAHGLSWSSGFGASSMAERIRLVHQERAVLGDDSYISGKILFADA